MPVCRRRGVAAGRSWISGVLLTGLLAVGLLAARPAYAIGRCDVHPIGNPDGVVTASDALVILRVSVHLLDASVAPPERADIAPPARPIVAGALIPGGDGTVFAEDALLCLRVAVGLLSIPANLVVAIESISPTRPVTGTTGTARVRVENDGDSDGGAGSTVSLRRGSPFPGPADAVATIEESISPGDARTIDVLFPAGDVSGRIELYALVETSALEIDAEDNVDSLAFEVNGPPIAHAGEDVENALEQTTVALDGSASSDPNDDPGDLSFAWSQKSGSPVNLAGADTAKPTFEAPDVSVETRLEFSLRVRDPDDLESQPAMVSVEVVPINDPPTAGAGEDQVDVDELTVVTLTGTADDPNEDPITTLWVQTGGPVVVLDAPNELTTTFTLPDISKDDTFVFELRVTDDENAVGTDALTIAALALNNHPVAAAAVLPSGSVLEATLVTLDGTASSDPDEDDLTFAWSKRAGPDVVLNDDGMGTATFEAPETATSNSSETLHFELLVEDGFGGFDSLEVEVEVRPDPLHPAQVIVRVTPPTALVRDQGETGPTMTVEVEVVPRDPFVLVPDGTPVELSATPFGVLDEIAGVTKLGLFTTKLTSDPQPGETVVRADVPGTSAAGEAHPSFHVSPNEVGRLSLILDPATVVVGSGESVRVAAVAYPADEGIGSVQDATILDFAATGGTFPAGGSAGTIDGVAVVPFEPPTEPGPVEITVAGSAEASATLTVLSNPEAAGAPRLEAEHLTIVAGGAETTVSTFVEPELRGAAVAPTTQVAFRAEPGLLDGDAILVFGKTVMVATDALPEEFDRPPLGDFPGLGDLDADGDGTLDVPGGRVARVTFSHPDPVSEPVQVEIDAVIVGSSMVDSIRITVVPAPTDPGSVALTSKRPAIVAGGTGAMLTASVDAAAGGPVADDTPVEFASSRGLLVPPSQATSVGSASTGLSHSEAFDLTARLRARA